MKLNEKIIALRNKYQMSQGDLAEKLNVSRQSVSKWETGASIPDLDKLIAMSELFGITMDELVKEDAVFGQVKEAPVVTKTSMEQGVKSQIREKENTLVVKIIGAILVALTPVMVILGTLGLIPFGRFINVISLYLLICGAICLFSGKNVGRKIGIMTIAIIAIMIAVVILNMVVY